MSIKQENNDNPIKSKSNIIVWSICVLIVLLVIGQTILSNIKTNALVKNATKANSAKQLSALMTLYQRGDYYDLLQATTPPERLAVAQLLSKTQTPESYTMSIAFAKDVDVEVKNEILKAIKNYANVKVDEVAKTLSQTNTDVISLVSQALYEVGDPALNAIIKTTSTVAARDNAGEILVKLCAQDPKRNDIVVPAILKILKSEKEDSQLYAINILGKIGDARAAQPIAEMLKKTPRVHRESIVALGLIHSPESQTILINALNNPAEESSARSQAAIGLGVLASSQNLSASEHQIIIMSLTNALMDLDSGVRSSAVSGLQKAGGEALPAIASLVNGKDPKIRADIAMIAGASLNSPQAFQILSITMKDPDPNVRKATAIAIRLSSPKNTPDVEAKRIDMLIALLNDPDGMVAMEASACLSTDEKYAPVLAQTLNSANTNAAFLAAEALGSIGDPAIPYLENMLDNKWAVLAIGRMKSEKAGALLFKVLNDHKSNASADQDISTIAKRALAINFGEIIN